MSTNVPDNAHVIALPPLIVAATLALGLVLQFVWPIRFLAGANALWLGAVLIAVSLPIVIGAASLESAATRPICPCSCASRNCVIGRFALDSAIGSAARVHATERRHRARRIVS